MTELIVPDRNEITGWDTARLRSELTRAVTLTAAGLAYLAMIWNELTRRGEDLSELRSGLALGIEIERRWCEHAAGRLAQSVMPGFDAPPAAEEGERELAPGAGGVPPELFPVLEGARS